MGHDYDLLAVELDKLRLHGHDPATMTPEERAAFVREQVLACEDELHEALKEVGWKSWATSRHLHRDAFLHELVDAQLFLDNLLLVALRPGQTVVELQAEVDQLVLERIERANQRQVDGYDGVAGKCPSCHRALDDVPPTAVDGNLHCGGCGTFLERAVA